MRVAQMCEFMWDFMYRSYGLAAQKNVDYHPDDVAYLEILQTAWETGITVEQDLWGRVRKQMSALRRFVIEGYLESESPSSRMRDIANYMAIMSVWLDHRSVILQGAVDFVSEKRACENSSNGCLGLLRREQCDRCRFLLWLSEQLLISVSRERPSLLTPRPPDSSDTDRGEPFNTISGPKKTLI